MSSKWTQTTIGEITEPISKWNQVDGGDKFLYFDISSIDNSTNKVTAPKQIKKEEAPSRAKQIVKSGDVLFSTVRTYLKNIAIVPDDYQDGIASTGFSVLRGKPGIDTKYLFYFTLSQGFLNSISRHQRGSSYPAVRDDDVRNEDIRIPDEATQQKIVDKIEELFSVTDNNTASLKATKRTLINLRRKILDYAFKGELTKDIHDADFDYDLSLQELEASRKKLFSFYKGGRYKQVSGEVKKNAKWITIPLEFFGLIETGATPLRGNAEYWKNGTVPWVTSTVVNQQKVSEASEFITDKALKETNTKLFPVGTLLIAMYGEGKTRGKVSELLIEAATNQALAGVILSEEAEQYKDFIKLFLYKNYEDLRRLASGGVQPNLNLTMIKEMQIPFPSKKEQSAIIDILTRYLSIIDNAIAQIDQILAMAENLRQSILKQAFDGKLV